MVVELIGIVIMHNVSIFRGLSFPMMFVSSHSPPKLSVKANSETTTLNKSIPK